MTVNEVGAYVLLAGFVALMLAYAWVRRMERRAPRCATGCRRIVPAAGHYCGPCTAALGPPFPDWPPEAQARLWWAIEHPEEDELL